MIDFSDFQILQHICILLRVTEEERLRLNDLTFQKKVIKELRDYGYQIERIDEEEPIFYLNNMICIYFPNSGEALILLKAFIRGYISDNDLGNVAYIIRNQPGWCVFRVIRSMR